MREFAGRRDDQGERRAGGGEARRAAEQRDGEGEAVGDGLAGPGLGGHQQVAPLGAGLQDGLLDRRRLGVAALGEGAFEGGIGRRERHGDAIRRRLRPPPRPDRERSEVGKDTPK